MALSADSGKAINQKAIFQTGYEWQADSRPAGDRRIRKGRAALSRAPDGVAAYQLRPTRQKTRIYRYVRSNRCRSRLCLTNLSGLAGMRWRNVQADKRNIFIHFDHMLFILTYHKALNLTTASRYPVRFLLKKMADLLLRFLVLI